MKFQLDKDPVRIEGCSQASITSLLEDLMNTGTHMRRLINVAETCINGTDDMSLIRIAFGRSLSSYLTFLQGTFVSMRDSYRGKRVHVPGLYHRMSGVAVLLERLSLLFCCHHTQDMEAERVSRLGFYIPPGPDLLSMLYDETTLYSMSQDSLWISLLQSLLDHASKPYRDIISRWLGITPSAPSGANRSQSSTTRETQLLGIFNTRGSAPVERYSRNDQGEAIGNQQSMFSVFDIHLQQSLQSLDLYGEFFVESKHSWSWDGSDPILLGEPLDYNLEFQRSAYVKPAAFIDDTLADQTVDAGKELQILIEYEPRHPLIAHDRNSMQENSGIKWFYAQDDISKLDRRCAESRHEVLKALTTRLRRMGWIRQLSGVDHRDSSLRNETLGANDGASIPFSAQDMIDVDPTPEHFDSESMIRASTERRLWKDLEMDPALAGFFSHSATVGNFQEMAFACPDMMSFLLEPLSTGKDSSGPHSSFSATNKLSLLDVVPPLTVLADYSLKYSIRARTSLIHTCVLSLYFHDLNLRGYFDIVGRFLLMRDGSFRARLSEALFDEETGLLFKAVYAANNPADHNQTSTGLSMARHKGKKWPPRTGELEMALRAVLLDSLQPVTADSDIGGGHSENETQRNHSQTARSQEYDEEGNRHGSFKPLDRTIDPQHLEEILAFAVREYDDKDVVCQDANALEALDFLYLDYRPPRPLRLLPLTSSALGKYTQLFTFQLRLARVGASLKQMYRDLRHRHIDLRRFSSEMESSPNLQQAIGAEMAILHRFRFEAQQIFDGLQSYMTDIALGSTWQKFMRQLLLLQQKVEHRIVGSKINPTSRGGGVEGDSSKDWSREDPPFNDGADKESMDQGPVLENLSDLHKYHEHILDLMLAQSFLLRKQAPVLGIVYSLLDDILQLCQFLQRLALPSDELLEMTEDDADMDQDEGGNSTHQARIHTRIERLKELHRDFRSHCQTLIRVLRRLDERGIDVGNAATLSGSSGMHRAERPETVARTATLRRHTLSTAEPTSTGSAPSGDSLSDQFTRARYSDKETITGFAPQLLLRLDISGFNSN
ncbi:hypothetical protein BGW38_003228 [Lunasporangiospora selenospora]|uniref:Spindle pole body component n=1 Tax=Lunasporangiospora selenospora TaxID=979761 RepID=A0A9P6FRT2_9FUNG|nr:hypothetical protein BGW38_003228 [Lunasporangiospora selenospora]